MASNDEKVQLIWDLVIQAGEGSKTLEDMRDQIDVVKDAIKKLQKEYKETPKVIGAAIKIVNSSLKKNKLFTSAITQAVKEYEIEMKQASTDTPKVWDEGVKEAQKYRDTIEEIKAKLLKFSTQSGLSLKDLGEGFKSAGLAASGDLNTAIKELNKESDKTPSIFDRIKSAAGILFGSVLGISAVQALRKLIAAFKALAVESEKYSGAQFRLMVALRGLQRSGVTTTLKEWGTIIDDLSQKFDVFSKQEIMDSFSKAALTLREFGFTASQISEVVQDSINVAITANKGLAESVTAISTALSSQWFTTIRRLGTAIDEQTVTALAVKKHLIDANGEYNTFLTRSEKAALILEVITESMKKVSQDTESYASTAEGAVTRQTKAWENLRDTISISLQPVMVGFFTWLTKMTTTVTQSIKIMSIGYISFLEVIDSFIARVTLRGEEQAKKIAQITHNADAMIQRIVLGISDANAAIGNLSQPPPTGTVAGQDNSVDLLKQLKLRYLADQQRYNQQIEDEEERHTSNLGKIASDFNIKWARLLEDQQRKRQELVQAEVDKETSARKKAHNRELKAEEDFQEKLRKLKENFLLSLEDAVRERDAKAVLQLIRKYNLQKDQLQRQFDLDKEQRDRLHAQEMADLEAAKNDRLAKYDEEARIKRQRAKEDYATRRAEENARHQQELADLERHLKERLKLYVDQFIVRNDLTEEQTAALLNQLLDVFGRGGRIMQIYADFFNARNRLFAQQAAQTQALINSIIAPLVAFTGNIKAGTTFTPSVPKNAGGYAQGGSFIANAPTIAMFGEAGPEKVTATPLNQTNNAPSGFLSLHIGLSDGLEAQIVNSSLEEVSAIIERVARETA